MDERTMPLVVFACPTCGFQEQVRLTLHVRAVGHPDYMQPYPRCTNEGHLMNPVQIDYVH